MSNFAVLGKGTKAAAPPHGGAEAGVDTCCLRPYINLDAGKLMKMIRLGVSALGVVLCGVLCLFQARCTNSVGPEDARPVPFRVHNGYSVNSSFGAEDSTTCLEFKDKASFGNILYWIADHNPYEPIPDADFQTRIFPVVIKKGNSLWTMEVESVTYVQSDKSLHVYFRSTLVAENMTWIALIPLVLSIETVEYSNIDFYENGNFLDSVPFIR